MPNEKKFLDANGLTYFSTILNNYPNNEVLGAVINAIDSELSTKAPNELATQTTPGLMSAIDKTVLDNLNPNIAEHLTPSTNDLYLTNAKQENLLECLLRFEPKIGARIRTSNLLDVSNCTPGFYIGSNGSNATNANDILGPFIPVTPGQDIYYTGVVGATTSSSINRRLHVYNANQTWIKQMSFAGSLKIGNSWSTHGVVPSNGAYIRVSWGSNDTNVMISVGAPSAYEPYEITPFVPLSTAENPGTVQLFQYTDQSQTIGQTYNISIPASVGSIYACRIDPVAGTLISTTGHIASYNGETLPGLWFSDRDTYEEGSSPSIGAQVVYALEEADYVEYDLTPVIIPLYYHTNYFVCEEGGIILSFTYYAETLGVNHITLYDGMKFGNIHINEDNVQSWNDTVTALDTKAPIESPEFTGAPTAPNPGANVNSTRIATTQFVQSKFNNIIAPIENSTKASKNYEIGQYLIYAGTLYKVTAAIASGTTMTVGTNIEATTVMNELYLLFQSL